MTVGRYRYAIALSFLVAVLGAVRADAGKATNPYPGLMTAAQPCNPADFVGGAFYPLGQGPWAGLGHPFTGDSVTGTVYPSWGALSGWWLNDVANGIFLGSELLVDGSVVSTYNPYARRASPLAWATGKSGTGAHGVLVRIFTSNLERTKSCYLDSELHNPVYVY